MVNIQQTGSKKGKNNVDKSLITVKQRVPKLQTFPMRDTFKKKYSSYTRAYFSDYRNTSK